MFQVVTLSLAPSERLRIKPEVRNPRWWLNKTKLNVSQLLHSSWIEHLPFCPRLSGLMVVFFLQGSSISSQNRWSFLKPDRIKSTAGMPQGTWLGPLSHSSYWSLIWILHDQLTNSLMTWLLQKFVPSAGIPAGAKQHSLSELHSQASSNCMPMHLNKTEEMTLGPVAQHVLDS